MSHWYQQLQVLRAENISGSLLRGDGECVHACMHHSRDWPHSLAAGPLPARNGDHPEARTHLASRKNSRVNSRFGHSFRPPVPNSPTNAVTSLTPTHPHVSAHGSRSIVDGQLPPSWTPGPRCCILEGPSGVVNRPTGTAWRPGKDSAFLGERRSSVVNLRKFFVFGCSVDSFHRIFIFPIPSQSSSIHQASQSAQLSSEKLLIPSTRNIPE